MTKSSEDVESIEIAVDLISDLDSIAKDPSPSKKPKLDSPEEIPEYIPR